MLITVRVHPRAARARTAWNEGILEVWVTAPAIGGAANKAVIKVVAHALDVPAGAVKLRFGARSRAKVFEVIK